MSNLHSPWILDKAPAAAFVLFVQGVPHRCKRIRPTQLATVRSAWACSAGVLVLEGGIDSGTGVDAVHGAGGDADRAKEGGGRRKKLADGALQMLGRYPAEGGNQAGLRLRHCLGERQQPVSSR